MPTQHGEVVGHVKAIYCYPVKSMRGESLAEARLGFRGLVGDRRFAFIQTANTSGFPWLMGCQFSGLVRYTPSFIDPSAPHKSAVRVRIPDGEGLPLKGELLREHLEQGNQRTIHLLSSISTARTTSLRCH